MESKKLMKMSTALWFSCVTLGFRMRELAKVRRDTLNKKRLADLKIYFLSHSEPPVDAI